MRHPGAAARRRQLVPPVMGGVAARFLYRSPNHWSSVMDLPIDTIPGTNPPRFRWRQRVETILGLRWQNCEGRLPPAVEGAVSSLIDAAKQQAQEIEDLKRINAGFADRIAAQSEILAAHAEKSKVATATAPEPESQQFSSKSRRERGR